VYQVLTKRATRMADVVRAQLTEAAEKSHIWWGVSVENRHVGIPRIEALQSMPVAVRFLSIEPLLEDLGRIDLQGIDWVIVGGESGPHARPMAPAWVRGIRDQCREAAVPFFFKQWGGVRKNETGRRLDGRTYSAFPSHRRRAAPNAEARHQLLISETFA
jgi:protein gp37